LVGEHLEGADLRGADLSEANLHEVIYDAETHWPDGFPSAAPEQPNGIDNETE
jgi:Pentapeptide repeats (8 copies)